MKTFISTLATLVLLFFTTVLFAQDPPYILVTETDTYANLENATEVTSVGDFWDDPSFTFPIGFDFNFLGQTGNTLFMNGDYFLGGVVNFPFSFNGVGNPLFVNFDDVIDIENADPNLQSSISYQLDGSAGDQIFKLEWKDVGFFNEYDAFGTAENQMNFQLWIYEGSNNFEIRFGPATYTDTVGLIHDLEGPTSGFIDSLDLNNETFKAFWHLAGNPLKPSLNSIESIGGLYTASMLSDRPADGMVYRFINPISNTENFVKNNAMKVYPSLVSNQFFVEVDDDLLSEKTTLSINDQLGRPIFNKIITNNKTELSLGHLPNGFYYATIFNETGSGTIKIVKVD